MTIDSKLTLIGAGAILALDAIASLVSVHLHFAYVLFCPATLVLYLGLSYWAAKHLSLRGTLAFGAFLGLVDATAGWRLCSWLGADPDHRLEKSTFSMWCATVIFVAALGALLAFIAFLIASYRKK